MKTQICLLGGEVMPNVIGALYDQVERILPVASKDSLRGVDALERALKAAGRARAIEEPQVVDPFDEEMCLDVIASLAASHPDASVNWTGGTKVMSYAARETAKAKGLRSLYVNTQHNEVKIHDGGSYSSHIIDANALGLNVLVQLLSAGLTVEHGESWEEFRNRHMPAPELVDAAELLFDLDTRIRYGDIKKLAKAGNEPFAPRDLTAEQLNVLTEAHLIQPATGNGRYFLSPKTRLRTFHRQDPADANAVFLEATHIEVFLWSQLAERHRFDDVAWSVLINPHQSGRLAEFDLLIEHENRFLTIECKRNVAAKDLPDLIEETSAASRRVGRLFGKWMLYIDLYADQFAEQVGGAFDPQIKRAGEYNGKLVFRDDISDFYNIIDRFLKERPAL